jgi:multiple sugar transport system substrate-binding protein
MQRPRRRSGRHRRLLRYLLAACLLAGAVGCSSAESDGNTLNWYVFQEPSGAFEQAAHRCSQRSGGRYQIAIQPLPASADAQREQLVRRLAAKDASVDILGMDVIWTAEFAEAGWIRPWTGPLRDEVARGTIPSTLQTATYEDRLWAAPFTTNAQLLWYRKDHVKEVPQTWDEMIQAARRLGTTIQVQANRYEGYTVWFNSLVFSAGGQILAGPEEPALGPPAIRAAEIMRQVAAAGVADPAISTSTEDTTRLAFEAGRSDFMVNYTFVWPSAQQNAPEVFEHMGYARWPRVKPDEPSHVTIGGINLGVGAFSERPAAAQEAAACLRSRTNQLVAAQLGGLPPTLEDLYATDLVREAFPFAEVLLATLKDAAQRPQTPAYNDISLAIQKTLHPPASIQPRQDIQELRQKIEQALQSGGLL